MQKLDDLQLEGSGFRFQEMEEVTLEIYKVNDIKASSWVELPPKYKNNNYKYKKRSILFFMVYPSIFTSC